MNIEPKSPQEPQVSAPRGEEDKTPTAATPPMPLQTGAQIVSVTLVWLRGENKLSIAATGNPNPKELIAMMAALANRIVQDMP